MSREILLQASDIHLKYRSAEILKEINLCIHKGESIAITGDSGSGKTKLGKIIAGKINFTNGDLFVSSSIVRLMVDQQDHFISFAGRRSAHYSQRYETQWMGHSPKVFSFLKSFNQKVNTSGKEGEIKDVMNLMGIDHLEKTELLQLSNGERKRTQIALALLQKPNLLVLDQPFIGLDKEARKNLSELLQRQMNSGTSLVIITSPDHIPNGVSRVIELDRGKISRNVDVTQYHPSFSENNWDKNIVDVQFFKLVPEVSKNLTDIVKMRKIKVNLGGKQVLYDIDWHIKRGERWVLLGPNGAGKTTLLSLITADNPQSYTNDLVLFDRKRGSGESIWEIKKRIGFVSPELHLYFLRGEGIYNTIPGLGEPETYYDSLTCRDVITSGFKDEVGFSSVPSDMEINIAEAWLGILNLKNLRKEPFVHASLGEQRLLLLARALVKSPELLILDEPCQGLDFYQEKRFLKILNEICEHVGTTLIYVTHRVEEIPACVNNQLILKNGRVENSGKFMR